MQGSIICVLNQKQIGMSLDVVVPEHSYESRHTQHIPLRARAILEQVRGEAGEEFPAHLVTQDQFFPLHKYDWMRNYGPRVVIAPDLSADFLEKLIPALHAMRAQCFVDCTTETIIGRMDSLNCERCSAVISQPKVFFNGKVIPAFGSVLAAGAYLGALQVYGLGWELESCVLPGVVDVTTILDGPGDWSLRIGYDDGFRFTSSNTTARGPLGKLSAVAFLDAFQNFWEGQEGKSLEATVQAAGGWMRQYVKQGLASQYHVFLDKPGRLRLVFQHRPSDPVLVKHYEPLVYGPSIFLQSVLPAGVERSVIIQ